MKRSLLALSVAILATSPLFAQHQPPAPAPTIAPHTDVADISALLEPIIKARNIPGMAAAVVVGDSLIAHGCAGVRRAGDAEKITLTDRFHLGSCTKSMTATMIATLVEEGTLKWDTTIGEVFPDIPTHEQWKSVRLDQLLSNSSGAPNDLNKDGLWQVLWRRQGSPVEQRLTLVTALLKNAPEAEPGARFIYSNAGFAIAGAMAEKITGTPWEDLMRQRLFTPLNITTAGFGPPGVRGDIDQPRGHRDNGRPVEPGRDADNPPAIAPAGTAHASIDDWAKYISLHLSAAQGRPRLLKPDTFTLLHTPAKLKGSRSHYAMGWAVDKRSWARGDADTDTGRVLTHNGTNTMWFCVTWLAPEKNFAVLIACNIGGREAEKACDDVAGALIKWHLEKTRQIAPPVAPPPAAE